MVILGGRVTKGSKYYSPILHKLLRFLEKDKGILCADSSYLSRRNCELIAKKGRVLYISQRRTL